MRDDPCRYRVVKHNGKGCKYFEKRKTIGYCTKFKMNCVPWHLKKIPFHLSHSAIQTWSQCRFKFYLSQILGWKPRKKSLPLLLGSYAHDFLAEYHDRSTDELPDFGLMPELTDRQRLMLEALLKAYTEKTERVKGNTEVSFFIQTTDTNLYL